jgi:hypothetical protein
LFLTTSDVSRTPSFLDPQRLGGGGGAGRDDGIERDGIDGDRYDGRFIDGGGGGGALDRPQLGADRGAPYDGGFEYCGAGADGGGAYDRPGALKPSRRFPSFALGGGGRD